MRLGTTPIGDGTRVIYNLKSIRDLIEVNLMKGPVQQTIPSLIALSRLDTIGTHQPSARGNLS
jgi:hypothetical protein